MGQRRPWRLHPSHGQVHLVRRYRVGRGGFGRYMQAALYLASASQGELVPSSRARASLVPRLERQVSSDCVVVSRDRHRLLLVL